MNYIQFREKGLDLKTIMRYLVKIRNNGKNKVKGSSIFLTAWCIGEVISEVW